MMMKIEDVSCGYSLEKGRQKVVLEHLNLEIGKGEVWCVLGANGIGKTTLFQTILGSLPPLNGTILLDQTEIHTLSKRELARKIAYVPQYHTPPFPFTVREIVLMGRNAYIDSFGMPVKADEEIAEQMMENLGIRHLADKVYTKISGGERQMALIARAMTQQAQILFMDEPSSSLDYGNQIQILKQIERLAGEGITVVFTSHHPEHAFLCHANVAVIKGKNELLTGKAEELITSELLYAIYGIHSRILQTEDENGKTVTAVVPFL